MEHTFKNSGIWEYFSSLNAAIKESKNDWKDDDDYSEGSLQISLDNLSVFGPMSLINKRFHPEQSINFEKDFQEYLENQEKLNQYENEELVYQHSKKKRKRDVKLDAKKNQSQLDDLNSISPFPNSSNGLAYKSQNNIDEGEEEEDKEEEDKEEHDKIEKIKLQNKERAK